MVTREVAKIYMEWYFHIIKNILSNNFRVNKFDVVFVIYCSFQTTFLASSFELFLCTLSVLSSKAHFKKCFIEKIHRKLLEFISPFTTILACSWAVKVFETLLKNCAYPVKSHKKTLRITRQCKPKYSLIQCASSLADCARPQKLRSAE